MTDARTLAIENTARQLDDMLDELDAQLADIDTPDTLHTELAAEREAVLGALDIHDAAPAMVPGFDR